ncbi:hypothetical protein PROFUN_04552 [Planoprotostelium fungivorum]|uniref:Uncharacterized protein n=1 Tax=Planoprotostelium fungivorum TaxID=1890364 RepID=A0A2P6NBJ5_9EUKA|nr:hypothetical protein PROFUN_04552 [Planoprotostelium fungivorum]
MSSMWSSGFLGESPELEEDREEIDRLRIVIRDHIQDISIRLSEIRDELSASEDHDDSYVYKLKTIFDVQEILSTVPVKKEVFKKNILQIIQKSSTSASLRQVFILRGMEHFLWIIRCKFIVIEDYLSSTPLVMKSVLRLSNAVERARDRLRAPMGVDGGNMELTNERQELLSKVQQLQKQLEESESAKFELHLEAATLRKQMERLQDSFYSSSVAGPNFGVSTLPARGLPLSSSYSSLSNPKTSVPLTRSMNRADTIAQMEQVQLSPETRRISYFSAVKRAESMLPPRSEIVSPKTEPIPRRRKPEMDAENSQEVSETEEEDMRDEFLDLLYDLATPRPPKKKPPPIDGSPVSPTMSPRDNGNIWRTTDRTGVPRSADIFLNQKGLRAQTMSAPAHSWVSRRSPTISSVPAEVSVIIYYGSTTTTQLRARIKANNDSTVREVIQGFLSNNRANLSKLEQDQKYSLFDPSSRLYLDPESTMGRYNFGRDVRLDLKVSPEEDVTREFVILTVTAPQLIDATLTVKIERHKTILDVIQRVQKKVAGEIAVGKWGIQLDRKWLDPRSRISSFDFVHMQPLVFLKRDSLTLR